jgi:hypothetical protein
LGSRLREKALCALVSGKEEETLVVTEDALKEQVLGARPEAWDQELAEEV